MGTLRQVQFHQVILDQHTNTNTAVTYRNHEGGDVNFIHPSQNKASGQYHKERGNELDQQQRPHSEYQQLQNKD